MDYELLLFVIDDSDKGGGDNYIDGYDHAVFFVHHHFYCHSYHYRYDCNNSVILLAILDLLMTLESIFIYKFILKHTETACHQSSIYCISHL